MAPLIWPGSECSAASSRSSPPRRLAFALSTLLVLSVMRWAVWSGSGASTGRSCNERLMIACSSRYSIVPLSSWSKEAKTAAIASGGASAIPSSRIAFANSDASSSPDESSSNWRNRSITRTNLSSSAFRMAPGIASVSRLPSSSPLNRLASTLLTRFLRSAMRLAALSSSGSSSGLCCTERTRRLCSSSYSIVPLSSASKEAKSALTDGSSGSKPSSASALTNSGPSMYPLASSSNWRNSSMTRDRHDCRARRICEGMVPSPSSLSGVAESFLLVAPDEASPVGVQ